MKPVVTGDAERIMQDDEDLIQEGVDEQESVDEKSLPEPLPEEQPRPIPAPSAVVLPATRAVSSRLFEEPPPPEEDALREVNGEDLTDLFDVSEEDVLGDTEEGLDELTDVDEEDVFGEGGDDLSDLTTVSNEDIMGRPRLPKRARPRRVRRSGGVPPQSMSGMSY